MELGGLVPYPDEGRDARDHRRPSALSARAKWLRANGKLRKALVATFRGLSKGLLVAV